MDLSQAEENYLKAIYVLCQVQPETHTSTNVLAQRLSLKPATITSMLIRLRERKLILYERYGKVRLTTAGKKVALQIVRKHRIWEMFLYTKLGFAWDEVHEVAEQLEHIQSEKLTERLDRLLGYPQFDPHGDPIPDAQGNLIIVKRKLLSEAEPGFKYRVVGTQDASDAFLKYMTQLCMGIGTEFHVRERVEYDNSLIVFLDKKEITVSAKFCQNVWVCDCFSCNNHNITACEFVQVYGKTL